jgi:hypothetical protein
MLNRIITELPEHVEAEKKYAILLVRGGRRGEDWEGEVGGRGRKRGRWEWEGEMGVRERGERIITELPEHVEAEKNM